MKIDGIIDEGLGRWCNTCDSYHGVLNACPNYSDETLKEIKKSYDLWIAKDPKDRWKCIGDKKPISKEMKITLKALFGIEDD